MKHGYTSERYVIKEKSGIV